MTRVTMLVSSDGGRLLRVAHRPLGEKPDRLAVMVESGPATDVSYTLLPGDRGTLFVVGKTGLGDGLLEAVKERPLVAEVDRGRAVVSLPGVKWRPMPTYH